MSHTDSCIFTTWSLVDETLWDGSGTFRTLILERRSPPLKVGFEVLPHNLFSLFSDCMSA